MEVDIPLQAKPLKIAGGNCFSIAVVEMDQCQGKEGDKDGDKDQMKSSHPRAFFPSPTSQHPQTGYSQNHLMRKEEVEDRERIDDGYDDGYNDNDDDDDLSIYSKGYLPSPSMGTNQAVSPSFVMPAMPSMSAMSPKTPKSSMTSISNIYGSASFTQRGYHTLDNASSSPSSPFSSYDRPRAVQSGLIAEVLQSASRRHNLPSPMGKMPSPPKPLSTSLMASANRSDLKRLSSTTSTTSSPIHSTPTKPNPKEESESKGEIAEEENDICFASRAARAAALEKQFQMLRG